MKNLVLRMTVYLFLVDFTLERLGICLAIGNLFVNLGIQYRICICTIRYLFGNLCFDSCLIIDMQSLKFVYTFLNLIISSNTFILFLLNKSLEFILKFIILFGYLIVEVLDILSILISLSFNTVDIGF